MEIAVIGITAVIVTGVVTYLILTNKELQKEKLASKRVQQELWRRLFNRQGQNPNAEDVAKAQSEVEALKRKEHAEKVKGVVERYEKDK